MNQAQPDVVYESQRYQSSQNQSKNSLPVVTDVWSLAKPSSYKLPKSSQYRVIFEYDIESGFFVENNFTKLLKQAQLIEDDLEIDVTLSEVIRVLKDLNNQETVTNSIIEHRQYRFSCFVFMLCIILPIIGLIIAYFVASCEDDAVERIIVGRIQRVRNFLKNLNETQFKNKIWKWRFGKGASWIELVHSEKVDSFFKDGQDLNGVNAKSFNDINWVDGTNYPTNSDNDPLNIKEGKNNLTSDQNKNKPLQESEYPDENNKFKSDDKPNSEYDAKKKFSVKETDNTNKEDDPLVLDNTQIKAEDELSKTTEKIEKTNKTVDKTSTSPRQEV